MAEDKSDAVCAVPCAEKCPCLILLRVFRLAVSFRILAAGRTGFVRDEPGLVVHRQRVRSRATGSRVLGGVCPVPLRGRYRGRAGLPHDACLPPRDRRLERGGRAQQSDRPRLGRSQPAGAELGESSTFQRAGCGAPGRAVGHGGLGLLRRSDHADRRGAVGLRRANSLYRGAAVRRAEMGRLFHRAADSRSSAWRWPRCRFSSWAC